MILLKPYIWLTVLLFLDLILLGIMLREQFAGEAVVAIALANPMQVFRTAAMMLFDQQLVLLGPTAYVILDHFGQAGYMAYAMLYPVTLGSLCAGAGYWWFKRGDLP